MSQNGRTTMLGTVKWFAKIWKRMLRRTLDALLPEPLRARTSTRGGAAGADARGVEEAAMTITDTVLLVCVTGTVLVAAAVTAGAVVAWAARRLMA